MKTVSVSTICALVLTTLLGCSSGNSTLKTNVDSLPQTCATGGSCRLGDTGPGGGLVFFTDSNDQYAGFTYIEIATSDMIDATGNPFKTRNCFEGGLMLSPNSSKIGRGPNNTKISSKYCPTGPGVVAVASRSNGLSDWYVPTSDELTLAYDVLAVNGLGGFETSNRQTPTCTSSFVDNLDVEGTGAIVVYLDPSILGIAGKSQESRGDQNCLIRVARAFG